MFLDAINALNQQMIIVKDLEHNTALAFVFSGQDDHLITSSNTCHDSPLQNLGRQRDDLHELLGTQLTGNRPEDTGADRL